MEVAKMKNKDEEEEEEEEEQVMLPGFRFHPTDDELVGFYLRRKVDKKPLRIQLIKQIDIYKYDPWDLPKVSTVGEKEWYFFCIRGRKYRNSIRPNRVTPSGFWKATGIDKPVHSHDSSIVIGLKKSLVYYRGSAGKGTKTDWMMHEFRLPPSTSTSTAAKNFAQEAEVWTLCRIFKRIPSYKKYTPPPPNWEKTSAGDSSSKTCSLESEISSEQQYYMGFGDSRVAVQQNVERKPFINHNSHAFMSSHQLNSVAHQSPFTASFSNLNGEDFFTNGSWDELRPVVELAIDPSHQVMIEKYGGMNLLEEISDREDEEGI